MVSGVKGSPQGCTEPELLRADCHVPDAGTTNGAVLTTSLPSGTSPPFPPFTSLGGSVLNDPVAWAGHGGTNFLFVIGKDAGMWYDKEGPTWSGFIKIGSGFTGVPGIVQDNGGSDHDPERIPGRKLITAS